MSAASGRSRFGSGTADSLSLIAAGDAIISRRVSNEPDRGFLGIRDLLLSADAALLNFETTTPRPPLVPSIAHGLPISSPAWVIDELRWMGFSLFGLANNHAAAWGWQSVVDTLEELEARGIATAGTGRTLREARAPAYLDTPHGRVALVSTTTTSAAAVLAADPGRGTAGRPGANPLRFGLEYLLDQDRFDALVEIDESLGTARARRAREEFGGRAALDPPGVAGTLQFVGSRFVRDALPAIRGTLHEPDIVGLEASIREAGRGADVVVASIHCHEGDGAVWNSDVAPDFLVDAAHRCVEAGAHVVTAHGPHRLRGVEVWQGRPILYSLGNFMLQLETVEPVPPEALLEAGLPPDATPAEYHEKSRIGPDGTAIGFDADPVWFEAIVVECTLAAGAVTSVVLHPIELGHEAPRSRRGVPRLVAADRGTAILERVADLSGPYGTELAIESRDGRAVALIEV